MRQSVHCERPTFLGLTRKSKEFFISLMFSLYAGMEKIMPNTCKMKVLTESPFWSTEKILCVQSYLQRQGKAIDTAFSTELEDWDVSENIPALGFDTTASTTGTCRRHMSSWSKIPAAFFWISHIITITWSLLPRKRMWHIWDLSLYKILISLFSRYKQKWQDISEE